MQQISNYIYLDSLFENLEIQNKILPNPYYNFPYLIIENFVSKKFLSNIINDIKKSSDAKKAQVKIQSEHGIVESELDEKFRKTTIYTMEEKYKKIYDKRFFSIKPKIENFYNSILTTSSEIQLLEYLLGSFYVKHADDSSELIDSDNTTVGFINVAPHRKFTIILFCSSYCNLIDY